ncbi:MULTISPECIES: hypothetical protein [Fusobacterium]|jgi:ABC-type transport system involved in multi-copper enzyme maturation permease subunit|nr:MULTISPECIES: hypothetical protein [Fusobacterium]EGR54264.1 hypothetical protein FVAG_03030 [Fusobacterium varium ATCC 27725]MCF2672639.1 hypothetical protein [Fusobacterium varium]MCI6031456.1 hypothetical protein [Fusobacterium varium]MDY4006453.1 hypothetical protein [Fusobacterium varium]UYI77210.1 MAG: hypothetical protein OGM09_08455 [Fusobacterium varium]
MEKILLYIIAILIIFVVKNWIYSTLIPFLFLIALLIVIPSLIIKK